LFELRKLKKLRTVDGPPSAPANILISAIGDIHGQFSALKDLNDRIGRVAARGKLSERRIFLGDYVDRGVDLKRVFDYLINLKSKRDCIFLRGNHDQYLLDFLEDSDIGPEWLRCGARETLAAYGIAINPGLFKKIDWEDVQEKFINAFPGEHKKFLQETQFSHIEGDFFFCHAGVDPDRPLSNQRENDLLWIREEFLKHRDPLEKIIVHGHTASKKPTIKRNRIGVDTAVCKTGKLSAILILGNELHLLNTEM